MNGSTLGSLGVTTCATLLLLASGAVAQEQCFTEIAIQVSPNVLNIQSEGDVVTVHTDIAYGAVVAASVTLNEVPINWSKSDNQGNFVAKFLMEEVKALAVGDDPVLAVGDWNDLTLLGQTAGGCVFAGTDQVLVIDNAPKGGR
jgi:hypothetical protein